jgi:hypothetical protein
VSHTKEFIDFKKALPKKTSKIKKLVENILKSIERNGNTSYGYQMKPGFEQPCCF